MTTVLIIEDEKKISDLLAEYFNQSSYQTHCLDNGNEVIEWLDTHHADLILLDVMLPGKDGITLCKEIRSQSNIPILMVTARIDEIDRLLGLELGADDYICKPFSPREVLARAKAVLRRSQHHPNEDKEGITMDDSRQQMQFHQQSVEFTTVEYQLLKLLASEPGHIHSRNKMMDVMYNDHRIVSDRTIDSHIKKIRKKLSGQFPEIEFIHSVYGAGYRFDPSIQEP